MVLCIISGLVMRHLFSECRSEQSSRTCQASLPSSLNVVLITILVAIVIWFLLSKTQFGQHLYAVGGNYEAAKRAGIPVNSSDHQGLCGRRYFVRDRRQPVGNAFYKRRCQRRCDNLVDGDRGRVYRRRQHVRR